MSLSVDEFVADIQQQINEIVASYIQYSSHGLVPWSKARSHLINEMYLSVITALNKLTNVDLSDEVYSAFILHSAEYMDDKED